METSLLSDNELTKKIILNNDHKAFKVFFNRYYQRLINFSIYFVKSSENAEDVVEEVFLKFLKMGDNALKIESTKAYLYKMAKNISLDFITKNKKNSFIQAFENIEDFQVLEKSSPSMILESNEFQSFVDKTIESFPPKRKLIFSLSRDELLTYSEISILLDISQKTIESHMRIALKTLREAVSDYDSSLKTSTRKLIIK